jgi:hypothetical protein
MYQWQQILTVGVLTTKGLVVSYVRVVRDCGDWSTGIEQKLVSASQHCVTTLMSTQSPDCHLGGSVTRAPTSAVARRRVRSAKPIKSPEQQSPAHVDSRTSFVVSVPRHRSFSNASDMLYSLTSFSALPFLLFEKGPQTLSRGFSVAS